MRYQLPDQHRLLHEERSIYRYVHAFLRKILALTWTDTAFRDLKKDVPYFPTVGMKKPGETLRANFGQDPFAFDIDKMVANEKAAIQAEIAHTSVANETDMIHDLIGQYLAHDGYVETARAFREEIVEEARALANEENGNVSYGEHVEDLDALNRQSRLMIVLSDSTC
jgi:hypothetical protein